MENTFLLFIKSIQTRYVFSDPLSKDLFSLKKPLNSTIVDILVFKCKIIFFLTMSK